MTRIEKTLTKSRTTKNLKSFESLAKKLQLDMMSGKKLDSYEAMLYARHISKNVSHNQNSLQKESYTPKEHQHEQNLPPIDNHLQKPLLNKDGFPPSLNRIESEDDYSEDNDSQEKNATV